MSKKWNESTPAQRRVMIAKDVIKWVRSDLIHVGTGNYVGTIRDESCPYDDKAPFGEHFDGKAGSEAVTKKDIDAIRESCSMSARGALLVARVSRFNSLTLSDIGFDEDYRDFEAGLEQTRIGLGGAFTERMLFKIECAFEGWGDSGQAALQFGKDFKNPSDRLLAIMQNIVDHDGTFSPSCRYTVQ